MDDEVKQLMALGRGCFVKRQYAQAERYLEQVLERTQSFADAYNMLGVIYHDQGRLERSEESFRTALRLNPAYTEAALNLAVACNDLGKYEEAKEAYQAALSGANGAAGGLDRFAQGKIANMHAEIADVYASCGRWAEAIGMRSLDPTRASDRAAASSAVADVLSGALEGTLPSARCSRSPADRRDVGDGDTVLARSCDGWAVVARMARRDGDPDTIDVRGPVPQ